MGSQVGSRAQADSEQQQSGEVLQRALPGESKDLPGMPAHPLTSRPGGGNRGVQSRRQPAGVGWAVVDARAYRPSTVGSVYKLGRGMETGGGGALSNAWHLHAWLQKGPSKAGQGRCPFPIWNLAGSPAPAPLSPFRRLTLLTGLYSSTLRKVQPLATFPIPKALAGTLRSLSKNTCPVSGSRHKHRASCCFPGQAGLPLLQGVACRAPPLTRHEPKVRPGWQWKADASE